MLSWEEMSVFGKNSLGNESSYNAGFAFVHYLSQKYGEDKLAEISRNLSSFSATTIGGAIGSAVGKDGEEVYEEWRQALTGQYSARVAPIRSNFVAGEMLRYGTGDDDYEVGEDANPYHGDRPETYMVPEGVRVEACCGFNAAKGFANLYPSLSPDGKQLAYVSTKQGDYFSQSSLFVLDLETEKEEHLVSAVRTAVSWSPDGGRVYYGKSTRDNPHWSQQFDIYAFDLREKEEIRITHGRRALSPAVSPDGTRIAFVVGRDGTGNLAVSASDGSDFRILTPFANGEQVYNPRWSPDGHRIVFDYSVKDGRDIAVIEADGTGLRFIVEGGDDSRSPVFTPDGTKILFSSDQTGIFNIYAYDLASQQTAQITNVLGGAFMPTISPSGDIIYAGYTSTGYKLFSMKNPGPVAAEGHHYIISGGSEGDERVGPLAMASNGSVTPQFDWEGLRSYDDTNLPEKESRSYRSRFTSLTIVPFLRVDNYNPRNTALETIKLGAYLYANDVLDHTGFFAGAALNSNLERDLFLQANYRGKVPLLYNLGLEPTVSAELYNVTRKTDNFIALGVDTIPVGVNYDLLEFDFVLSHPFVSRFSNVEFRYIHSRYTSLLQSFILPASGQLVSSSSDLYLIANDLSLSFRFDAIVPSTTSAINPLGRRIWLRIGQEFNKFNGDGEYTINSGGGLSPVYKDINFTRIEARWKEHIPFFLRNHSLTLAARGGTILGPAVDEFFDFYAGGLPGMKGYPFYSLGGNEFAMAGLAYRFPILHNIDLRILNFYFDKLYATVYGTIGDAWTGDVPAFKDFKADAGAELRLESFSFYSFPTRIFFNAAYGFDTFTKYIPSQNTTVTYGKDWSFYFGILFDFDID
jgi:hypothetical protein